MPHTTATATIIAKQSINTYIKTLQIIKKQKSDIQNNIASFQAILTELSKQEENIKKTIISERSKLSETQLEKFKAVPVGEKQLTIFFAPSFLSICNISEETCYAHESLVNYMQKNDLWFVGCNLSVTCYSILTQLEDFESGDYTTRPEGYRFHECYKINGPRALEAKHFTGLELYYSEEFKNWVKYQDLRTPESEIHNEAYYNDNEKLYIYHTEKIEQDKVLAIVKLKIPQKYKTVLVCRTK